MSKYNTGDRFWFEIKDVYEAGGKTIYDCSNGGFCVDPILDGFERLDPDEKANADYDAGYAEGLNAAWEAARKIFNYSHSDVNDALFNGNAHCGLSADGMARSALHSLSPQEAIEKIRKYEEKKDEIKAGDEVEYGRMVYVVTKITGDESHVLVIHTSGDVGAIPIDECKKTGRHFPEIENVLEQMKGGGDE